MDDDEITVDIGEDIHKDVKSLERKEDFGPGWDDVIQAEQTFLRASY